MATKNKAKVAQPSGTTDFLLKGSKEYSLYVTMQRAIPHVGDGLKPSQRIALWLLRNKSEKIKTVGLGGMMASERLYVHGDASANDAIGKLAAPFKNNVPLIEGLGSFGSRVKPVDGIGAPRYTEVRRTKAALAFLYNDLPIVPMKENYDGSNMQPVHFLPLIPIVLLNGVSGVAVGYSTSILPRAFQDIVKACIDALKGRKIKEMVPHFERYDVGVRNIGPSKWELTGKAQIKDTSTIVVTELPPNMDLEDFKEHLISMEDSNEISNFNDNSSDAISVEVQMKRGSIKGWTPDKAVDFLKIREKVTERIIVVDWNSDRIATYGDPAQLVKDFVKWRLAYYEQRYERYLGDAQYELQYWRLLAALFKGGFTAKLGKFKDRASMEAEVTKIAKSAKIAVDDSQIDRAVSIATYRWTKTFEAEVDQRIKELEAQVKDYTEILASPDRRKDIYISELEELKNLKL